jgi:hypothetical protein
MAKRSGEEINLLSVSFIDLLFGAMGAFIFLFIIIPKVSQQDMQTLRSVKDIKQGVASMDSMMAKLKKAVPPEDYNKILNLSAGLRASVKNLEVELNDVRTKYNQAVTNYKNVADKYDALVAERDKYQSRNEYLENQIQKLKPEDYIPPAEKAPDNAIVVDNKRDTVVTKDDIFRRDTALANAEKNRTDQAPEAVIGINFPFIVAIEWGDKNDKVHLYMKQKGSSSWCFYQTKRQRSSFGVWDKSLKKISPFPYEAIIQKEGIVPGEYEVYAQPYIAKSGKVEIKGYIAMKAGDNPIKRKNLIPKEIPISKSPTSGKTSDTFLGTVSVSSDNFQWNPAY